MLFFFYGFFGIIYIDKGGYMRTATKQEAINGNSNDTVITPLRLKQVLDTVDINPGEGGGSSDTPVYTAGEGISITNNVISNTITKTSQLTNDSNFITEEDLPDIIVNDPVPINSIWDYEGDTVPDGFIEIDPVAIPTKISELENDSNFINQIKTINGQSLVGEGNITIESGTGGSEEIETVVIPLSEPNNEDGAAIGNLITVQKMGKICTINLNGGEGMKLSANAGKTVAVLPEKYRPLLSFAIIGIAYNISWSGFYYVRAVVNSAGNVTLTNLSNTAFQIGQVIAMQMTYLTNE